MEANYARGRSPALPRARRPRRAHAGNRSLRDSRAVVGQDSMLESVFVALLAADTSPLEGVPGWQRRSRSDAGHVLGGSSSASSTHDIVLTDVWGRASIAGYRRLAPSSAPFLQLPADDESTARRPRPVGAVEVMRRPVDDRPLHFPVPAFSCSILRTDRDEGTYHCRAQVDRFMMRCGDIPVTGEELDVVYRSLRTRRACERCSRRATWRS